MISYTTAVALKEAGFPQNIGGGDQVYYKEKIYIHLGGGHLTSGNVQEGLYAEKGFTCCLDEYNKEDSDLFIGHSIFNIDDVKVVLIPTLSELIGVFQSRYKYIEGLINDAQVCLRKSISGNGTIYIAWLDGEWESSEYEERYRFIDATPEEVVAALYLELHK